MFLDSLKGDSRELQGYIKEVQGMFKGSFNAVSKSFKGSFKGVYRKCQVCFKKISKESFKGVSIMF